MTRAQVVESALVFVSYSDDDRERVLPLVRRLRRRWDVWWDRDNRIGEVWRALIADRLRHARCVVVVWTQRSITSRYVQEEAEEAAERGVLVPVRLDAVKPPIGFRSFQFADLARWDGRRHPELDRLVKSVASLLSGAVDVERGGASVKSSTSDSARGVRQARQLLGAVRAQTAMFKRNQPAAQALRAAFVGVAATYDAVGGAIDEFAAPLDRASALTSTRYRPLATGRLTADIEAQRGHCTQIAQSYIGEGGLRDSLPPTTQQAAVDELDRIFLDLSQADRDLFKAMIAVGEGLENESGVLLNLLLAGQRQAARERLERADRSLRPLVRQLNAGKRELNRLAGELGVVL